MTPGYPHHINQYIEERPLNRVETPEDLQTDIAKTLTHNHKHAELSYEERYIHIHYPTRMCPQCGVVNRMQVVVNSDVGKRYRECRECGELPVDRHVGAEYFMAARLDRHDWIVLEASP